MKIRRVRKRDTYNSYAYTSNETMDPLDSVTQFISYIDKLTVQPWDVMKPKHEEYSRILNTFRDTFSNSKLVYTVLSLDTDEGRRYLRPLSPRSNNKKQFRYTYVAVDKAMNEIIYDYKHMHEVDIRHKYKVSKRKFKKLASTLINQYEHMINYRNELAANYFRYVVSIANNFKRNPKSSMKFADIIQEGHIGLLKMIDSYNVNSDVRFTSYCIYGIVSQIKTALTGKSWMIRLPSWVIIGGYMISQETKKVLKEFSEYPTDDVLAELTDLPKERVTEIKEIINNMTSLYSLDHVRRYERSTYDGEYDDYTGNDSITNNAHIDLANHNHDAHSNDPAEMYEAKLLYTKFLNRLLNTLGINTDLQKQYTMAKLGLTDGYQYSDEDIARHLNIDIDTVNNIKLNIRNNVNKYYAQK